MKENEKNKTYCCFTHGGMTGENSHGDDGVKGKVKKDVKAAIG